MKFWQSIAFLPMQDLEVVTAAAEDAGFEGVGLAHHLVTPATIASPYPYTEDNNIWWDPRTPFPDPLVTAAALGARTPRIKFITSILILPLLEPLAAAKAISTAACFLPDRLCIGMAAGWMEEEYRYAGIDFKTRGRRLDEMIVVLRKLLRGEMVDHDGEFFQFDKVQMSPVPDGAVPLYGGGHSDAALRRAAHLDGWFSSGPYDPDTAEHVLRRLERAREAAGTADQPFDCIIGLTSKPDRSLYARMEAAGATSIVIVPSHYFGDGPTGLDDQLRFMDEFGEEFLQ